MAHKIAYIDCSAGIGGAELLGALCHAGLAREPIEAAFAQLPFSSAQLRIEKATESGLEGIRARITVPDVQKSYRLADLNALIRQAHYELAVQDQLLRIFRRLAEALATVQHEAIEEIIVFAAEALPALLEMVAVVVGLAALELHQLYASPLPLYSGYRPSSQIWQAVPSSVVLELLRTVQVPWQPAGVPAPDDEPVTIAGAALLAELAQFTSPLLDLESIGNGLGLLPGRGGVRIFVGREYLQQRFISPEAEIDQVTVIETHIDNMTGEELGWVMEQLFVAGALDVSYTPLQMKKNRPATLLSIIAREEDGERLALLVLRETGTLGVRMQHMQRLKAQRMPAQVMTPLGPMLMKVKRLGKSILRVAPEYEECQRVAHERGLPLDEVYEIAHKAAQAFMHTAEGNEQDAGDVL